MVASMSFQDKKALRFELEIGGQTVTLEQRRASVVVNNSGGMCMGNLHAQIYGVRQEDMDSATTLQWQQQELIRNTVKVTAIDGDVETLVFSGNIVQAWADYSNMPEVFLHIEAQSCYVGLIEPAEVKSYEGETDVATVMERIAGELNLSFENNGVDVKLHDGYYAGTPVEQARELADAANIDLYIDTEVLAICPRAQARKGDVPVFAADSGLIGYPTFDGIGVLVNVYFSPSVTFGGKIKIETDVPRAAGEWIVCGCTHVLESEKPGGAWQSNLRAVREGMAIGSL